MFYILKRKSSATVFCPLFLQHGPYLDIAIIIYDVSAQRVMSCRKMGFDHDFHSDAIVISVFQLVASNICMFTSTLNQTV